MNPYLPIDQQNIDDIELEQLTPIGGLRCGGQDIGKDDN